MAYFGGIFFANMGGGGGHNYFHMGPPSAIGSAIGRPYLAVSCLHALMELLSRLVLNHLRSSTVRFVVL